MKTWVVERYKHHRLVNEYNDMRQRVSELQEQIKQTQDKKLKPLLIKQLELFNVPPCPPSSDQVIPDENIGSQAKGLYDGLKVQEDQTLAEYEVDRLNVLNLLKVFEVEVTWGLDRDHSMVNDDGRDEQIATLQDENTSLQHKVIFFLSRPLTLFALIESRFSECLDEVREERRNWLECEC